jgi:hypothetical protein
MAISWTGRPQESTTGDRAATFGGSMMAISWTADLRSRYRLGLLSVTFSFRKDGGSMYSQASVMPVNAGDGAAHVIEKSEK